MDFGIKFVLVNTLPFHDVISLRKLLGSRQPFYVENIVMTACPEQEFWTVVGQDDIDRTEDQWTIKPDVKPTLYPDTTWSRSTQGSPRQFQEVRETTEVKEGGLLDVEVIAVRLASDPQHTSTSAWCHESLDSVTSCARHRLSIGL